MIAPKITFLLLFIVCSFCAVAQTKQQTVTSKIEKVTLFTSGGQVSRKAKLNLPAGKTELLFAGISPDIDKQSIQVKGEGRFTILSVIHQINYLNEQNRREEIIKIEQQQDVVNQKLVQERNMLQVYKNEEAMLLKNQSIGGSNTGVKTLDLKEAVDFQRNRLIEVYQKQTEISRNISRLDSATLKNSQQLRALNQNKNYATSEVLVTVQATTATSADFELSYFVKNAGWFATYDLNVKDISSPIELAFKANVFQHSGEDWKDVKLVVSNGNPTENSVAPALQPWYLRFGYNPPPGRQTVNRNEARGKVIDAKDGSPLLGVSVLVKGTNIGTVTDANGYFNLKLPENVSSLYFSYVGYIAKEMQASKNDMTVQLDPNTQALQEVVVTGLSLRDEDGRSDNLDRAPLRKMKMEMKSIPLETIESSHATTINYEIELPYTILNDGKVYKVDIKRMEVPAMYEYFVAPKMDKEAFLTAKIAEWQELNLLEGEINLFFEGAFLGKSILDLGNAGDTLNISLGKDKSIVVERKKMKEFSSKQFLSNYKTDNRGYEIIVRNNKQQPINIVIQDQFPISTTKDITVDEQESSGAQLDADTKLLTWKYQLEAKQEKKHVIKYGVKYPKNQVLVLE